MALDMNYDSLQTARVSAILPAAGVWDATPIEMRCMGADDVILYFTYTRGAAAGTFDYRIEVSPYSVNQVGVENWFMPSVRSPGLFAAGADQTSDIQRLGNETYDAVTANAEMFTLPLELNGCTQRIRVACREVGAIGTPGTVHAVVVFA